MLLTSQWCQSISFRGVRTGGVCACVLICVHTLELSTTHTCRHLRGACVLVCVHTVELSTTHTCRHLRGACVLVCVHTVEHSTTHTCRHLRCACVLVCVHKVEHSTTHTCRHLRCACVLVCVCTVEHSTTHTCRHLRCVYLSMSISDHLISKSSLTWGSGVLPEYLTIRHYRASPTQTRATAYLSTSLYLTTGLLQIKPVTTIFS